MAHSANRHAQRRPGLRLKLVALLLQVRWQNVIGLAIAQYVSAVFLFNDPEYWRSTISEYKLHGLIFSVAFLVAGGYLINNFYDREKDRINRPIRTAIEATIKKSTVLYGYLTFTILGSLLALSVSGRAFLFYAGYAFLMWAYSHKFKRITLLGNLLATFLVVIPFFGLLIYYNGYRWFIFYYGFFYSWLFFVRETVKDIRYYKGDLLTDYQTLPVVLGLKQALRLLQMHAFLGVFIAAGLWLHPFNVWLHGLSAITMVVFAVVVFYFRGKKTVSRARHLHLVMRLLLILGILIIPVLR